MYLVNCWLWVQTPDWDVHKDHTLYYDERDRQKNFPKMNQLIWDNSLSTNGRMRTFHFFMFHRTDYYVCWSYEQLVCLLWLTENWTNDRDKWISLNFRFYWSNRWQKLYECRITVVVSRRYILCWVLKVCVVEGHRLSCLSVCGDSTSRR